MKTNAYQAYRHVSVQSASPVGLVVILYDSALRSLYQAMQAIDAGKIEDRTACLNHALDIIGHLDGSLDLEIGGDTARTLSDFYSYTRARILEAGITNSRDKLAGLAVHLTDLRNAWQQVDSTAVLQ